MRFEYRGSGSGWVDAENADVDANALDTELSDTLGKNSRTGSCDWRQMESAMRVDLPCLVACSGRVESGRITTEQTTLRT